METAFNLFLWGVAGVLCLAPLGAGFGAIARGVAQINGNVPEKTLLEAMGNGFLGGGFTLAAAGFLFGAVVGYHDPDLGNGLAFIGKIAAGVFVLMLLATLFASLAYFCTWLGVRGTGLLLSLDIGLVFAGILAERVGMDVNVLRFVQCAVGFGGLFAVLWFRMRWPFESWPDDSDDAGEITTRRREP